MLLSTNWTRLFWFQSELLVFRDESYSISVILEGTLIKQIAKLCRRAAILTQVFCFTLQSLTSSTNMKTDR